MEGVQCAHLYFRALWLTSYTIPLNYKKTPQCGQKWVYKAFKGQLAIEHFPYFSYRRLLRH